MTYEIAENEILVRIPISNNKQRIKEMLDYLLYEAKSSRTEVSQDTADEMLAEIKKGRFERLRINELPEKNINKNILDYGFCGIWENNCNMTDSTEYIRNIRRSEFRF